MTTQSQNARILAHLKKGRAITPLDALRMFGSFRLSGRIYDLKRAGHRIEKTMVRSGRKRWAKYQLAKQRRTP